MPKFEGSAIIVFDGRCVLCNGWVRLLLRHDRAGKYRFTSIQSAAGRALLLEQGLDPNDPASFLLIETNGAWTETEAIGRVLSGLGGSWCLLSPAMMLVPRALRDRCYRLVAWHRYRWFGRRDRCVVPEQEEQERFLS